MVDRPDVTRFLVKADVFPGLFGFDGQSVRFETGRVTIGLPIDRRRSLHLAQIGGLEGCDGSAMVGREPIDLIIVTMVTNGIPVLLGW